MQILTPPSGGHAPMRLRRPMTLVEPVGVSPSGMRHIRSYMLSVPRRIASLSPPAALLWLPAVTASVALIPMPAHAHVKWFAAYDVTEAPAPLSGVLSRHFLLAFAAFTLLLVGSFLLDRLVATKVPALAAPGKHADIEERLLRAGTGAFFMALFATGGTILTPELRTTADWPAWLQLGIAASMLSARTCAIGSLGILVLYGYGVDLYGVFHLSDYPMFIGLAVYLGLTSFVSERPRAQRMLVLHASICISLMWGAVEKWAYPQWTFPLLEARPYLTFGMAPADFMVVAGFVEFAFAFYILTGLGLLRLAILGLGTIFAAAIVDFGKIDAIGHLPILIAMVAMFLHGPTRLQLWLHDNSDGIFRKARTASTAFATTLIIFFAAYYGLQYAEYGHGSLGHEFVLFVSPAHALLNLVPETAGGNRRPPRRGTMIIVTLCQAGPMFACSDQRPDSATSHSVAVNAVSRKSLDRENLVHYRISGEVIKVTYVDIQRRVSQLEGERSGDARVEPGHMTNINYARQSCTRLGRCPIEPVRK